MRIVSNISNITDNSGTAPVVTYSNQVQTLINTPSIPHNNCPRICGIVLCNNNFCTPFDRCNCNNTCNGNNFNPRFANNFSCNCHSCSCCHQCNHSCNCGNNFNANFQSNNFDSSNFCQCCACSNNFQNSCNCNNNSEIIYHYYCNEWNN